MKKTVADVLVERLINWGVTTIFGLPGDGINGIFESLRTRQDKIRFIQVRHEEAAAFAACAYASLSPRIFRNGTSRTIRLPQRTFRSTAINFSPEHPLTSDQPGEGSLLGDQCRAEGCDLGRT